MSLGKNTLLAGFSVYAIVDATGWCKSIKIEHFKAEFSQKILNYSNKLKLISIFLIYQLPLNFLDFIHLKNIKNKLKKMKNKTKIITYIELK